MSDRPDHCPLADAAELGPYAICEDRLEPETVARRRGGTGMPSWSLAGSNAGCRTRCSASLRSTDDEIVGDDGAVYRMSGMAVHSDQQGRGVGTRIMDALEDTRRGAAVPSQLFRRPATSSRV